jgi:hypothetical protein
MHSHLPLQIKEASKQVSFLKTEENRLDDDMYSRIINSMEIGTLPLINQKL